MAPKIFQENASLGNLLLREIANISASSYFFSLYKSNKLRISLSIDSSKYLAMSHSHSVVADLQTPIDNGLQARK